MSKASKHRFCPAVEREITSTDCGQNRGGRYACPAHCLHSPLASANYDLLLAIEDEVDRKTQERLAVEMHTAPDLSKMLQQVSAAPSPHIFHALIEVMLFFQRDANGLSLAERWQREGFPGLKNDERVLFQAKMQTRVALLEIHRIIDDQQVEAVDLLEPSPKPFILRDRSLADIATPFATSLAWVYPLPHYWRIAGTIMLLPKFTQLRPEEMVRETARHLGAPATEKELRIWLAENFVRMDEALHEKKQRGDFPVEFEAANTAQEDRAFLEEPIDESHLPPATLPPGPLPASAVVNRTKAMLTQFPTADEAIDYLDACDSAFIDHAIDLCDLAMDPFDLDYLLPWIVQIRFILVPFGFRESVLNYERLVANLEQRIALLKREGNILSPELIEEWFANSRQSDIARLTVLNLLESSMHLPKEERPTAPRELFMTLILILLIDELDQAIREEPLSV